MFNYLYRPVDAAIFIYFRFFTGILLSQELINGLIIGKFDEYIYPNFHFSYMWFPNIKPWPYWGMVFHYSLTIFSGFAVAFNYRYRFFSIILFCGYTLLFLFEQTEYINHSYLYCLISFWLAVLPLNENKNTYPIWMLYLIQFHIALAYFFGGIAKINMDWLNGTPMDIFLAERKNHPLSFIYLMKSSPLIFSYWGLIFDLLVVPALILKSTRTIAFLFAIIFHISNVMMFGLATFPWFSLVMTSMFFHPSWPRKISILKSFLPGKDERPSYIKPNKSLICILFFYVLIHLALPLRHLFYPGVTSWTEEGHMFSWRMMLRDKKGVIKFFIKKKDQKRMIEVDPLLHISKRQFDDIIGKPDLILQFAHHLRDYYKRIWRVDVSVYASSRTSLNGRAKKEMIVPGTDLSKEKRTIFPYHWVRQL